MSDGSKLTSAKILKCSAFQKLQINLVNTYKGIKSRSSFQLVSIVNSFESKILDFQRGSDYQSCVSSDTIRMRAVGIFVKIKIGISLSANL